MCMNSYLGLDIVQGLHLLPYIVHGNIDGSWEIAQMPRLVWLFTGILCNKHQNLMLGQGAQWLSGRVLDSRPKGRGFEPHWRHCVVVLEQDTFILA